MPRRREILSKMAAQMDPDGCGFLPVIEIVGNDRVLIESHCAVAEYSDTSILIRMGKRLVSVDGYDLYLAEINAHRLIVCGKIHGVSFSEGCP